MTLCHLILCKDSEIVKLLMTLNAAVSTAATRGGWSPVNETDFLGVGKEIYVKKYSNNYPKAPTILLTTYLVHFAIIHLLITIHSHVIHPKEKQELNS